MFFLNSNGRFYQWLIHFGIYFLVIGLILPLSRAAAQAKNQDLKPQDVEKAIQEGVQYLVATQKADGSWATMGDNTVGLTALCTLALQNSGLTPDQPTIRKAFSYLERHETANNYAVSLRIMAFCQAGETAARRLVVDRDVKWLLENHLDNGGWDYGDRNNVTQGDESVSQFAILALEAAEAFGISIPAEVWKKSEEFWTSRHKANGGWGYRGSEATGSMTCAGIASMVIVRGRLLGQSKVVNDSILCCEEFDKKNDPVESGLKFLGDHFAVDQNPISRSSWLYYLYALERVGRLTGRRLIGGHDWYREGAELLIRKRDANSGWIGNGPGEQTSRDVATSFALLFLSKGKRRVLIHRAEHGNDEDWNLHPGALRQLNRSVEKIWKQDLTWQTVRLEGATLEELLQAPVLYLSGPKPLDLSDATKQLLRRYIEQGGFIFAEASSGNGCGDPKPFEDSLRSLCRELFKADLELLPPSHPVYHAEQEVEIDALPKGFLLYGVQACCRTSVVYSPLALSCRWELFQPDRPGHYSSQTVSRELNASIAIGQNVLAYATGRELKDKLEQPRIVKDGDTGGPAPRGAIVVPRIDLGGGGEQAPRALPNLLDWTRNSLPIRIQTEPKPVAFTKQTLQNYPILFTHGRDRFTLTRDQRETLKEYLTSGGALIANAICGSKEYTEAFRKEMKLAVPELVFETLPRTHPLLSPAYHGFDITRVTLRRPAPNDAGVQTSETFAEIEVGRIGEQVVLIFSPKDLSCALENQNSPQCEGYTIEDAAKIGINMVLYTLLH